MPRSCVQIRFHFVFEFGFMDGSSFEPCLDDLVAYATWLRPDSVLLRFEFSFMNGSSFEPCSHHFGRVCYVVAFQIRFHDSQSNMTQLLCLP